MNYEPSTFDQFVGQTKVKRELNAMLANNDKSNLIFRGNYGSGKTTLATIYAAMRGLYTYVHIPQEFKGVSRQDVSSHIIDEIHLEESYERFFEQMKKHTFIFCTTETEKLPAPFMSRCIEMVMEDYSEFDLQEILYRYAEEESIEIGIGTTSVIAERAKFTPRVAIQLLRRLHNMSVYENEKLTENYAVKTLDSLRVLSNGLTEDDIKYLSILYSSESPVSLNTLSAAINRSIGFIKDSLEPFLIYKRFIGVTSRGRILLPDGKNVISELAERSLI